VGIARQNGPESFMMNKERVASQPRVDHLFSQSPPCTLCVCACAYACMCVCADSLTQFDSVFYPSPVKFSPFPVFLGGVAAVTLDC